MAVTGTFGHDGNPSTTKDLQRLVAQKTLPQTTNSVTVLS